MSLVDSEIPAIEQNMNVRPQQQAVVHAMLSRFRDGPYVRSLLGTDLEVVFGEAFGSTEALDERPRRPQLTIVATDLDPASERIVTYLQGFGVPINAVFFSYLEDGDRRYLTRSWLVPPSEVAASARHTGSSRTRAEWNGRDWFVSFGEYAGGRSWEDGRRFGFVSAGGGDWYSRSLRSLPAGARINVHIPGRGYVAVGETLADALPADEAMVLAQDEWVPLLSQNLAGTYRHELSDSEAAGDTREWVVPVRWLVAHEADRAFWQKGMFANQNSACKLRQQFTIERLEDHFGLESGSAG